MEGHFNDLIQEQTELQGRITRIVDNMKKLGQANITEGAVQSRLATLDGYWSRFEELHRMLRTVHKDAIRRHEYTKGDVPGTVEEIYLTQKGLLLDYAACIAKQTKSAETAAVVRADSSAVRSSLPRIQLPHFAGKFEEWPSFKDLFQSLIGKETQLNEVDKLHYLKVSLKGEAEILVKNLPTTADNYSRAWDTLCSYFENKRLLVRSCLSKYTSLQKMKTESASEMRKVLHGVTSTASTLESIGRPVSSCEDLFVHLSAELLDPRTRREWEHSIEQSPDPPAYESLRGFLERRMHTLEIMQPSKDEPSASKANEHSGRSARTHHIQKRESGSGRCSVCKEDHFLMFCAKYKAKSAQERKIHVESNNLCFNCLSKHKVSDCVSKRTCSVCHEKHHTSLHDAWRKVPSGTSEAKAAVVTHNAVQRRLSVLLATARILVVDRFGNLHNARALIDQGSEITIITERLTQRLHLSRQHTSVAIFGVGGHQTSVAKGRVTLRLLSRTGKDEVTASAIVLPRLTAYTNGTDVSSCEWLHLEGLQLADLSYSSADSIVVLLGADVYAEILCEGIQKGKLCEPVAQQTIFGWVLSGKVSSSEKEESAVTHQCTVGEPLSALVRKFWEQEEVPAIAQPLTPDEQKCEDIFRQSHARTAEGRYVIRLPMSSSLPVLSGTREAAVRSLLHTERRFLKNQEFGEQYKTFMSQYENLGHMTKVSGIIPQHGRTCFLPHHGVFYVNPAPQQKSE